MVTKFCALVILGFALQYVHLEERTVTGDAIGLAGASDIPQQAAVNQLAIHQGAWSKGAQTYFLLIGDWAETTVNEMKCWRPVGNGPHMLELGYPSEPATIIDVFPSGEVYDGDMALLVDVEHQDHFEFVAGAAPTCDGSYSTVRGVVTTGECWGAGQYDRHTGCTTWKCNQANEEECHATITFVNPETPTVQPVWTCGDTGSPGSVTSCPGPYGGTATVAGATSGC